LRLDGELELRPGGDQHDVGQLVRDAAQHVAALGDTVLPPTVSARVAVEAAVAQSWYKFVGFTGEIISIEHYGESADDKTLFREFGFTPEAVVAAAERTIAN
jgi:transketolase